jgi:hypothetical protein
MKKLISLPESEFILMVENNLKFSTSSREIKQKQRAHRLRMFAMTLHQNSNGDKFNPLGAS